MTKAHFSLIALLLVVTGVSSVRAEPLMPTVTQLKTDKPTHLLFVGNSYLYFGDSLHNHVRRMVIAAGHFSLSYCKAAVR